MRKWLLVIEPMENSESWNKGCRRVVWGEYKTLKRCKEDFELGIKANFRHLEIIAKDYSNKTKNVILSYDR